MKNKNCLTDENYELNVDILMIEKANKKLENIRKQIIKINDRISVKKEYTQEDLDDVVRLLEDVLKIEQDIVQNIEENVQE